MTGPIVLSASRRTDIPAFYMDWFMEGIRKGWFETVNPYNRKKRLVPATPAQLSAIVFWSKDYGGFLRGEYGRRLLSLGYRLYFHFTINSASCLLEPGLPPLDERLKQAAGLSRFFGPRTLAWRFDPICFYTREDGVECDNLKDFGHIAEWMAGIGVQRCITSFLDIYPKITRRPAPYPGFRFIDPPLERKMQVLKQLSDVLSQTSISLQTCCEKEVMAALPPDIPVRSGACMDNRLLASLYGGEFCFKKDKGQRTNLGCECQESTDIGDYITQPCFHNCRFCYANPAHENRKS